MTLNSGAAQVFQDTLKSPEVVSYHYFFQFLVKERSNVFVNLLKGKSGDQVSMFVECIYSEALYYVLRYSVTYSNTIVLCSYVYGVHI